MAVQGSKAREGPAAIFRAISKWASHISRSAGRNWAENVDGQSPLKTLDASTTSPHFFAEIPK